MKKIILAFDSFKGSLSSNEIANAATDGIRKVFPDCNIVSVPMADGGEGTTEAICSRVVTKKIFCKVHDPLMREITASYSIAEDGNTAIMEMAVASGLPLVEMEFRNPMDTTTYGTGEMIRDAIEKGCKKIILGIGGSATNDGGMGVLSALGVEFYDKNGKILDPIGNSLTEVADFNLSALKRYKNIDFVIACDVINPFYGPNGAAYIFSPQKGASDTVVKILDEGLHNFSNVIKEKLGVDISQLPGAGAAGGLGGGIKAFLNASLLSGSDVILDIFKFNELLTDADLILTGEGKIDAQTRSGKALSGILKRAKKANVPVIVLAGAVEDSIALNEDGYTAVFSIQSEPVTIEKAMSKDYASQNIKNLVIQIMRIINL